MKGSISTTFRLVLLSLSTTPSMSRSRMASPLSRAFLPAPSLSLALRALVSSGPRKSLYRLSLVSLTAMSSCLRIREGQSREHGRGQDLPKDL